MAPQATALEQGWPGRARSEGQQEAATGAAVPDDTRQTFLARETVAETHCLFEGRYR